MNRTAIVVGGLAVLLIVGGVLATSMNRPPPPQAPKPLTAAELAMREEAAQRTRPHTVLKVEIERGVKSAKGEGLILSGVVVNSADFAVKDPEIHCLIHAANYQRLARLAKILEGEIPAKGSKRFENFEIGDLPPGVSGFNCGVDVAAVAS